MGVPHDPFPPERNQRWNKTMKKLTDQDKASCEEIYPQAKAFVVAVEKLADAWLKEQENNTHEE